MPAWADRALKCGQPFNSYQFTEAIGIFPPPGLRLPSSPSGGGWGEGSVVAAIGFSLRGRNGAPLDTATIMEGVRFLIYVEKPKSASSAQTMRTRTEEPLPSLAELEAEAEACGRQVARDCLQEKLQRLAEIQGEVFPPKPTAPVAPAAAKPAVTRYGALQAWCRGCWGGLGAMRAWSGGGAGARRYCSIGFP